jgi:iron complex outermembrane receptor protein
MKKVNCYGLILLCFSLLAAFSVHAEDADIDVVLPEVTVKESKIDSTTPGYSSSGTLTDLPLLETPLSIDVVPEEMIRDREPSSFYEILDYVSGTQTGGRTPMSRTAGEISMRGFSGNGVSLNGFQLPTHIPIYLDASVIKRVDFVKGPLNSISGGQNSSLGAYGSGGSVNILTKSPDSSAFGETSIHGSWNSGQSYRALLDVNRPLSSLDSNFRISAAVESEQPFYLPDDIDRGRKVVLAPSWDWNVTDRFSLSMNGVVQWQDTASYQGIPYYHNQFVTDSDAYFGNDDARDEYLATIYQIRAKYRISQHINLNAGVSYAMSDLDRTYWSAVHSAVRGSGLTYEQFYESVLSTGTSRLSYSWSDTKQQNTEALFYFDGQFELGTTTHNWVVGTNWLEEHTERDDLYGDYTAETNLNSPDIYVPDNLQSSGNSKTTVETAGLFLQDQVSIGNWRVLAGVRTDRHASDQGNSATAVSPRLGLTYLITPSLSVYGNYTYAEAPNYGYNDADGKEITEPWKSTMMETGVKKNVGKNFWAGLAYFHITQENTPSLLDPPQARLYELEGEVVSQGIEINMAGYLTKAWFCQLSYTYTDYENKDAEQQLNSFPPHSISLWQTYTLPDNILWGTTFGLGYRYVDQTDASFRGQYIGDGYVFGSYQVCDFLVKVPLEKKIFGLNLGAVKFSVKNIFDEEYVESSRHVSEAFPGEPLTFEVSLSAVF